MTVSSTGRAGWITRIQAAYEEGRSLALLFDYDGTLTPLARHPSLARLSSANRDRLAALAALDRVSVGVLSGRPLDEVRAFVGLDFLNYVGSGGLELALDGERIVYPGTKRFGEVLAPLEEALIPVISRFPSAWVERKPAALSLHHRGLPPPVAVRFRVEVAAILQHHPALAQRVVTDTVEVAPAGAWDRGTAVEFILSRLTPDVLPVYFGGGTVIAEATSVVSVAGGMVVAIGPDAPPTTSYRLTSPLELGPYLDRLVQKLTPRSPEARPTRPQPPTHAPALPRPEPTAKREANLVAGRRGVLIADPDAAFRQEFKFALEALGWRVWGTGEPEEALALLREHRQQLQAVVVNLQFPGLQGVRLLNEVGRQGPHLVRCGLAAEVPLYATTAFRRLSNTPLFHKPLDFALVSSTLHRLVAEQDRPD